MAGSLRYSAFIDEKGKLHFNRQNFQFDMRMMAGMDVIISVRPMEKSITGAQHKFYRGVILPLIHEAFVELGWERYKLKLKDIHEVLWSCFGKFGLLDMDDIGDLSSEIFQEYLLYLQKFCAEFLNLVLPDSLTNN